MFPLSASPPLRAEAHKQKFPDGYGFRMDVNEFLRGLSTEGSLFDALIEGQTLGGGFLGRQEPSLEGCQSWDGGHLWQ